MEEAQFHYRQEEAGEIRRLWMRCFFYPADAGEEEPLEEALLLDTGADFTFVSDALAEDMGIDLEEEEADDYLVREWRRTGRHLPHKFIEERWRDAENRAIPTTFLGAKDDDDDDVLEGYFYPVQIGLDGNEPIWIPVLFVTGQINAPGLGRGGIFERTTSIEYDGKEGVGTITYEP